MTAAVQVDERGEPILYYPEEPYPSAASRRLRNTRRPEGGVVASLRSGASAAGDALRSATDRALAALPAEAEAALRQKAEQAKPFLPHAACALVGLLLGRMLGRRAERRRWTRGSAPPRKGGKRASEPELEARLHDADRDARRADAELAALHAEMKQLERQLQRSKARAVAGVDDDDDVISGAALRTKLSEAAAAYDTLARVLAAERATGALRLARAAAENELLQEQLAQVRAAGGTLTRTPNREHAARMGRTTPAQSMLHAYTCAAGGRGCGGVAPAASRR